MDCFKSKASIQNSRLHHDGRCDTFIASIIAAIKTIKWRHNIRGNKQARRRRSHIGQTTRKKAEILLLGAQVRTVCWSSLRRFVYTLFKYMMYLICRTFLDKLPPTLRLPSFEYTNRRFIFFYVVFFVQFTKSLNMVLTLFVLTFWVAVFVPSLLPYRLWLWAACLIFQGMALSTSWNCFN